MPYAASLQTLHDSLASLRKRQTGAAEFCRQWRAETALLAALPVRYAQVMEDILGRLEAGSLFAEESCSFSQEDLHAHLATWLDKARQTLQADGQA
jgi:hypothetical protein